MHLANTIAILQGKSLNFGQSDYCKPPQDTPEQHYLYFWGWSGGAIVLGKLPVPGRPTIWTIVGQGPIALAVGAGGACLDIFTLLYPFSPLSPSLWETARYRLKYCLKGSLPPKQPTNKNYLYFQYVICR